MHSEKYSVSGVRRSMMTPALSTTAEPGSLKALSVDHCTT